MSTPFYGQKTVTLYDRYKNVSLDEFDNCDYVYRVTDVNCTDLVIMQLNIRGIGSKKSQLIDLIDNSVQDKQPDILLISETWLTLSPPNWIFPAMICIGKIVCIRRVEV